MQSNPGQFQPDDHSGTFCFRRTATRNSRPTRFAHFQSMFEVAHDPIPRDKIGNRQGMHDRDKGHGSNRMPLERLIALPDSVPLSGDEVVAPLPPVMTTNIGARFERDPAERRKGLNGQHAFPYNRRRNNRCRSPVADKRRNETQGKLVVHARRATWNGIRLGRLVRSG